MRLYYSCFTERDPRNRYEEVLESLAQSAVERKTEFGFPDCVQISGWSFSKITQAVLLLESLLSFFTRVMEIDSNDHATFCLLEGKSLDVHMGAAILIL